MKIRNILLPMLVAGAAPRLAAQTVTLRAGSTVSLQVEPRTSVVIPLVIDPSGSGGLSLGSLGLGLNWNAARLRFDSLKAGSLGAVGPDVSNAAAGSVSLALTASAVIVAPTTLATAYFTSTAGIGGTRLTLNTTSASDAAGSDVRAQVRVRHLDVCVAGEALWGDGNGDKRVDIIDAQQVARFSVALSVANFDAIAGQADVNIDGAVNVIDAQQIARFSVGLSASPRVNTKSSNAPSVNTIALSDLVPVTYIGFPTELGATPSDVLSNAINGCHPITWSSNAPEIATVDSTGRIVGHATGRATITATSEGRSQSGLVTVLALPSTGVAPFTLSVVAGSGQTAFVRATPAIKPEILVSDALGRPMPNEDVQFTVSSGGGSVPGTGVVQTAPNGRATLTGWKLGLIPGTNTLTASVSGSSSTATVTATGKVEFTIDFTMPWPLPEAGGVQPSSDVTIPTASAHVPSFPYPVVSTTVSGAGRTASLVYKGPQTLAQQCGHCWYGAIDLNGVAPGSYWFVFLATDSIGNQVTDSVQYTMPTAVATITAAVGNAALVIGSTTQATAILRDGSGSILPNTLAIPRPVFWTSSDTTVAKVSKSGVITAVGNGTASITASREGQSGSVSVTVASAPAAASLTITAGDAQTGYAHEVLPNAVRIRLLDVSGNPLSNVTVTFAVASGGGTLVGSPTVQTDANGIASTTGWKLGDTPGTNTLTASAPGVSPVTVSATGIVRIVINFAVAWPVPEPGGVRAATDVTVPSASASISWRPYRVVSATVNGAGRSAALVYKGPRTLAQQCSDCWYGSVDLNGVAPGAYWFVFQATDSLGNQVADSVQYTVPPAVATITAAVGNPALVIASTTQATATLRDGSGSVLPNTSAIPRPVVWTSSDTTIARVSTMGLVTAVANGTASITASREGQSGSVGITVGGAPTPSSLVVTAGNTQTGYALEALPNAVKVKLLDGSGNPLSNVTVTFAVASGGGTFVGSTSAQTDANGIATTTGWRLGSLPGANTLTASVTGVSSVTISATAIVKLTLDFAMAWPVQQAGGVQVSNDVMIPEISAHIVSRPHAVTSATVRAAGRTATLTFLGPQTISQKCANCWYGGFNVAGVAPGTYWFVFEATDAIGTYVADSVQYTTPTAVATISVGLGSAGLVPGSTTQATATLRDASGAVLPKTYPTFRPVVWTSSDVTVATVNAQGVVTAVGNGTATISASREGQTGGTAVTVSP
ncbi:MAG: Ig-like domain-containing protein [Gemmatimonadota bacterium]